MSNLEIFLNSTRNDESNRLFCLDKNSLKIKTYANLTDHKREHFFKALVNDRLILTLLAKFSISIDLIDDKINTPPKFLINQYKFLIIIHRIL